MMLVTREPVTETQSGFSQYAFKSSSDILGDRIHSERKLSGISSDQFTTEEPLFGPYPLDKAYIDSLYPLDNSELHSNIAYLPFGESSIDPGYDSEKSEEEEDWRQSSYEIESSSEDEEEESVSRHSLADSLAGGIRLDVDYLKKIFPFINESTLIHVILTKNSRGLGISVSGGVESDTESLPGMIRIKRIYPQTPAWVCGQLRVNDFILKANKNHLTGLTSHEALEVLRTCSTEVELTICRASEDVIEGIQTTSQNDVGDCGVVISSLTNFDLPSNDQFLSPSSSMSLCGEFEINLTKVSGSLGFTLKKNDNSILGHTIRSLVKEPAISDGRIRPGDKLLSVNGTDLCGLSHEQAVRFLRTCPEEVVIRIYRDAIQTPISPASPTEPEFSRPKILRQEARDMLFDLANQKRCSPTQDSNSDTLNRRRKLKNCTSDNKLNRWESLVREAENPSTEVEDITNDFLASTETLSQRSLSRTMFESRSDSVSPDSSSSSGPRPTRPNFLDLSPSGQIKKHSRKDRGGFLPPSFDRDFSTTPPQEFESLNDLSHLKSTRSDDQIGQNQSEFHSINDPTLLAGRIEPVVSSTISDHDLNSRLTGSAAQESGLLKWKGIRFNKDSSTDSEDGEHYQIFSLSLSRGWSSRLGFSISQRDGETYVSVVYEDSIAAKDGRIQDGDIILEVNGEDVRNLPLETVIEKLRIIRGKIHLKLKRNPQFSHFQIPNSDSNSQFSHFQIPNSYSQFSNTNLNIDS